MERLKRERADAAAAAAARLRPSKLGLGEAFPGSQMAKRRESQKKASPSDRHLIENGARLFEALIVSCRGNTNPIRMFSGKELMEATDGYDKGRFVGSGGMSEVYRGIHDGRPIAVKRGCSRFFGPNGAFDSFLNEMVSLAQINHRNVVRLLGCCIETQDPILVFELVPGGSLYQHIHVADASLRIPWADRLRIAVEVADALNYLHTALHTPIVHCNVRSSSILLDDCYSAKLATFAFSELVPKEGMRAPKHSLGNGSYANSDTVYDLGNRKTQKDDAFCFGLVLIELLTGKRPSIGEDVGAHTINLQHFVSSTQDNSLGSVLDGSILSEANPEQLMACAWVAVRSVTEDVERRPTMKEVVQELRRIRG